MAYKIIWSPKAEETFEKVIEYLKENWTDKQKEVELLAVFDTRQHPKKKFS